MAATLFLVFEAFRFSWLGRTETSVHPDCNICFTFSVGLAGASSCCTSADVDVRGTAGLETDATAKKDRRYREGPS